MDKTKLLSRLISQEESDFLDFKQQWPKNNVDLVHDILCMANSESEKKDRFLVFGVTDEDHSVVGVESNTKRRKKDDLYNLLVSKMSVVPELSIITVPSEGKEVDILKITPKDKDLPYVLNQSLSEGKARLQKNAVYVRNGSTNTAKDSCADIKSLQELFRRREGRNLRTIDQFRHYIQDAKNWDIPDDEHPTENPIFCKSDTQLTIRVEEIEGHWRLSSHTEIRNYSDFINIAPLNEEVWNYKKLPTDCSSEETLSLISVGVYWGVVPILKRNLIQICVKHEPFVGYHIFFLPDLGYANTIKSKKGLIKSTEYHICRLLAYFTDLSKEENDRILDYINWEYLKNRGKYYDNHKELLYAERPDWRTKRIH